MSIAYLYIKQYALKTRLLLFRLINTFLWVLPGFSVFPQSPTNYPPVETKPIELTPVNIIVYFVLPVIIVIAYFLIRRYFRKKREKESEENKH